MEFNDPFTDMPQIHPWYGRRPEPEFHWGDFLVSAAVLSPVLLAIGVSMVGLLVVAIICVSCEFAWEKTIGRLNK